MNKKPILHLYGSKEETTIAIHQFIQNNATALEDINYRYSLVNLKDSANYFITYNGYEYSKSNELNKQWYDIRFNLDLPTHIKNHYLSRIRY